MNEFLKAPLNSGNILKPVRMLRNHSLQLMVRENIAQKQQLGKAIPRKKGRFPF